MTHATPLIGYFPSTEEYDPAQLLEQAALAERAGFDGLWVSDHFHPWNDEQGQSPFVWSIIGAMSQLCRLPVTTAVTCPTMRMQPTIVAQAAATANVLLDGRFTLGVGSGEALNEHIHGDAWPSADVRLDMLREAVAVIRELWTGKVVDHHGEHFTVENARIYTRLSDPPPIHVSGFGKRSTELAAEIGDGYITTSPDSELLGLFRERAPGRPASIGTKVSFARTEDEGVQHAHRLWANAGLPGELAQVLPAPEHFEQASKLVTKESTRSSVVCGSDLDRHVAQLRECIDAGFDQVYVANMGPYYADMIEFYGERVLPAVRGT
ncbi:MAG: TIGR03557 family F420-dependent LLM class oxidoreductase [Nocardioidaceae bacterium]|nr:TIGR03557 family F420-dependent LLM class oxidoreductase [Nocardioidaceae bacterium]